METFLEFVAFFNKQSKIETYTPSKISIFHGKNAKNRFSCPSGYDELRDQMTARTRCVLACGRPNGDLS